MKIKADGQADILRLGSILVAIWLFTVGFSVQNTFPQSVKKHNSSTRKWKLEVAEDSRVFKKGSEGVLSIKLFNGSKDNLYFVRMFDEDDFEIELLDASNQKVGMTDAAKSRKTLPKTGREFLVRVGPGENANFDLKLANRFDLQSGWYTLVVRRFLLDSDKITERTISSKPTRIQIKT